ncbi:hypothetical protein FHR51_004044 [Xanthomonas arboricola]|nr:hypothetical protein [Xanthomonas cannabis]
MVGGQGPRSKRAASVECAAPSPLAGHAVNLSMGARWRHPCRHRARNRRGHRTRNLAGGFTEERRHRVADPPIAVLKTLRTDHLDWSLPAHRRGTLSGMDAAPEPPWTDSRRVPRRWAGKGPAANAQPRSSARCPHRSRDTPLTRPWGLGGGIHAANGPASGEDTAPERWSAAFLKTYRRCVLRRSRAGPCSQAACPPNSAAPICQWAWPLVSRSKSRQHRMHHMRRLTT